MANEDIERLKGKVALLTGASRGIGKAIARRYVEAGARVFICARGPHDLASAIDEIRGVGGEIDGAAGDISQIADVQRIVAAAQVRFGAVDVLVNNASILGPRVPIAEYPERAWQQVIDVNLTGLFLMTREVMGSMLARRQGSIINLSSGVGRTGKARWGAYAVSKFGVEGFSQVLADELKGSGVRVNVVNPGATRTAMRAAAYPDEDPLTLPMPETLGEIFVYLASDKAAGVHGRSLEARSPRIDLEG
ncbi:MAG: SDR family oxidoreductase [Deltaproteobacteria bacterium]|nr:SDR family oxidoreductase [Deltaproteobacteria bacterium]